VCEKVYGEEKRRQSALAAELSGVWRNRRDLKDIEKVIRRLRKDRAVQGADVAEIRASSLAGKRPLLEHLLKISHSVKLGDALIGATAHLHGMPLWTLNKKRYAMKAIRFYGG